LYSCLSSFFSYEIQDRFSQLRSEKNKLHQQTQSHQITIKALQEQLSAKNNTIEQMNHKCVHFQEQLEKIKQMELKIRRYLGLQFDDKDIENHSHQGGFAVVSNQSPLSSSSQIEPLLEPDQDTLLSINYVSVTKGLEQITNYLLEKKKILNTIPSILPVAGEDIWLSSGYGWRVNPFTSRKEFHAAIDIAGRLKTPIIAPADGTVIETGHNKFWGKYIKIEHGQGLVTAYGHLHSIAVSKGKKVKRRDVIGYMGNTGHSTGTHLHYQVIRDNDPVNPKQFVLDRDFNSLSLKEQYEEKQRS
jgi:murein DD-endopeptidase MepM/ murein hydrolase activator NlpD